MTAYFWILLGSALGGMARFGVSGAVARLTGETFPWGTLVVNVTGSFVIGLFAALTASTGVLPGQVTVREFVMVGLCGGYTTFSSFSLQTLALARDGEWGRVAFNTAASVVFCLIAAWLGFAAGALIPGG